MALDLSSQKVQSSLASLSEPSGAIISLDAKKANTILEYPPSEMTANTTSITSGIYGTGTYVASASSQIDANRSPFLVFESSLLDSGVDSIWSTPESGGVGVYNSTTGSYTGTVGTLAQNGTTYNGEWLQIDLPQSISLASFSLLPRQRNSLWLTRSPRTFVVLGSKDGNAWNLVYTGTDINWSISEKTFTVLSQKVYSKFRLITSVIGNTDGETTKSSINLARWRLFGTPSTAISGVPVSSLGTFAPPSVVQNGLIAHIDPSNLSSYSGSGASIYNLVNGSTIGTLGGTYNTTTGGINLVNIGLFDTTNTSNLQLGSLTGIRTMSIWYRQNSSQNMTRYLIDARVGSSNSWVFSGSIGNPTWYDGTNGTLYKNGGSSITPTWANIETVGSWQNITLISTTSITDDITLFTRYTRDQGGLDVTFGPILIYNRAITQAENTSNFNAIRARYSLDGGVASPIQPVEFPPAELTSNITTITSGSYANGTYIASASSQVDEVRIPYLAFESSLLDSGSTDSIWASSNSSVYNTTTGTYIGSVSTLADNITYNGEWLQIELPQSIRLTSFSILPRQWSSFWLAQSPNTFVILGSNDGTSWKLINSQAGINWTTATQAFTVNSANSYSKYRLVTSIVGNSDQTSGKVAVSIARWRLNGTLEGPLAYPTGGFNNGSYIGVSSANNRALVSNTTANINIATNRGLTVSALARIKSASSTTSATDGVYPPAAMTANSTTISNQTYGNGRYVASRSSISTSDSVAAFDKNSSTYWDSGGGRYDADGVYYINNPVLPPSGMTGGSTTFSGFTSGNGLYTVAVSSTESGSAGYLAFDRSTTGSSFWSSSIGVYNSAGSYTGSASIWSTSGEWIHLTYGVNYAPKTVTITCLDPSRAPGTLYGINSGAINTSLLTASDWVSSPTQTFTLAGTPSGRSYWGILVPTLAGTGGSLRIDEISFTQRDHTSTTDSAATIHYGEWVQLQLPNSIYLKSFTLTANNTLGNNPTTFALLGSANGTNWDLVYNTPVSVTLSTSGSTFLTNNSNLYSYFRLIGKSVSPTGSSSWVRIYDMSLTQSGVPQVPFTIFDGRDITGSQRVHLGQGATFIHPLDYVEIIGENPISITESTTTEYVGNNFTYNNIVAPPSQTLSKTVLLLWTTTDYYYQFVVPVTTTYNIILQSLMPNGNNDSLFTSLNGKSFDTYGTTGTQSRHFAFRTIYSSVTLTAGTHTLTLRRRETVAIGSIIIQSTDSKYYGYSVNNTNLYGSIHNGDSVYPRISSVGLNKITLDKFQRYTLTYNDITGSVKTYVNNNLVGTDTAIAVYPPEVMAANTTSISTAVYGNGSYIASSSTSTTGSLAFDKSLSNSWSSSVIYNTNGSYAGNVSTTAGSSVYSGEWLQLQMPVSIRLTKYSINSTTTTPSSFALVGSSDGNTWATIDSQTNVTNWISTNTYTVNTTSYYSYLRLIITNTVSTATSVSITELYLFGTEQITNKTLTTLSVGRSMFNGGTTSSLDIADLRVYDRELTQSELQTISNVATKPKFSSSSSITNITNNAKGIVSLDPKSMDFVDGTPVSEWNGFSQSTDSRRPIYRASGGYNNGPYLEFKKGSKQFLSASGTTNFAMGNNGGFTIAGIARFPSDSTLNERIVELTGTGYGSGANNFVVSRAGTDNNLKITSLNTSSGSEAVSAVSTWTSRGYGGTIVWNSICWSAELSLFVGTANSSTIITSSDGVIWTGVTGASNNWRSVTWSPDLSLFVAVADEGTGNRVMTSPDGINWTTRTSAANNNWISVVWAKELSIFVAVGYSGTGNRVMTSSNGINWTTRTSAADNQWLSVTWSSQLRLFVAVSNTGTGNRVMTSPDGITWTTRSSPVDNNWRSIVWSPELSLFVVVSDSGTGNRVMTSSNGIVWTTRVSAANNDWKGITWAPELGLFVAVGFTGTGSRIMSSPNGINWTTRSNPIDNQWATVAWSPELGIFAALSVSGTSNRVMTSTPMQLGTQAITTNNLIYKNEWVPFAARYNASDATLQVYKGTTANTTTSVLEYPPTAMTAATTTISNQNYGNGSYIASQSASASGTVAFYAFDKSITTATRYWGMGGKYDSSGNYLGNNEVFPPAAMTGGSTTFSGLTTANGTYTVAVSSTSTGSAGYLAMDRSTSGSSFWNSMTSVYNSAGSYIGSSSIFSTSGEWIYLAGPSNYLPKSVSITCLDPSKAPSTFYITNNISLYTSLITAGNWTTSPTQTFTTGLSSTSSGLSGRNNWGILATTLAGTGGSLRIDEISFTQVDSNTTIDTTATNHKGEWIQLQMPNSILLKSFSLTRAAVVDSHPKTFALLGSSDGTTWNLLNNTTTPVTLSTSGSMFTTNSSSQYNYYRLVIKTVSNENGGNLASVYEMKLFASLTDRTFTQALLGKSSGEIYSNMDLAGLWMYDRPLSDRELRKLYSSITTGSSPDSQLTKLEASISDTLDLGSAVLAIDAKSEAARPNVTTPVLEYPPDNRITANITNVSGNDYGNGVYLCSASSVYSVESARIASNAFESTTQYVSTDSFWHSELTYNTTTGSYIGTVTTIAQNGTSYPGEWLQIGLPQAISLSSYSILPRQDSNLWLTRSPNTFVILGSNDGISWNLVNSQTSIGNWTSAAKTFVANSGVAYSFYRIAISVIGNSNVITGRLTVQISRWRLYGNASDTSSLIYPPSPLTSNSTTISGTSTSYAAGTYTASASSTTTGSAFTPFSSADTLVSGQKAYWESALNFNSTTGGFANAATSWATRTSPDNEWWEVCWSAELSLFVAVGYTGNTSGVITSPDGITWTTRTTNTNQWTCIAWAPELSLLVALAQTGTGNRAMTSSDGINWTTQSTPADNTWRSIVWSAELRLFVAVAVSGTGNRVMTSPDGINWTIRTSAADNNWQTVCWSKEQRLFVAVATSGVGNRVMTSSDGITWTTRSSAADNSWRGVVWSAELSLFVAVAYSGTGNRVMTSPNGITWTTRSSAADNAWRGIVWSAELSLFVAIAYSGTGNRIMTSSNGVTWTTRSSAVDNPWSFITWSPQLNIFVAVSDSGAGNRVMTSGGLGSESGEFLQLQLPKTIAPSSFTILPRQDATSATQDSPRYFLLLGSNDGTSYDLLYKGENVSWSTAAQEFPITNSKASRYNYFRLLTTCVGNASVSSGKSSLQIAGLTFEETINTSSKISSQISLSDLIQSDPTKAPQQITQSSVLEFPPQELTANTSAILSADYGNGSYIVSASSQIDGNRNPDLVFESSPLDTENNDSIWSSTDSESIYNSTTGSYVGSVTTTVRNGTVYSGEWIQISLPNTIRLTSFKILPRQFSFWNRRSPNTFIILGSNDGTGWDLVYSASNVDNWSISSKTFYVNSNSQFSYYRLVTSVVGNSASSGKTSINISRWQLYGTISEENYLSFNSSKQQHLTIPSTPLAVNTNGGFTALARVRFTGSPAINEPIFDFGSQIEMFRSGTTGNLALALFNGTSGSTITAGSLITQGEFATLAARYRKSDNRVELFKNGKQIATATNSVTLTDRTSSGLIARPNNSNDSYANINLSSLYVFDRYLSNSELDMVTDLASGSSSSLTATSRYVPATSSRIVQVPPATSQTITSATFTISDSSYGNGTFVVSTASERSGRESYRVFNYSTTDQFGTPSGTYNTTTGSQRLNLDLTGTGYLGSWIKLQMPYNLRLTRYQIKSTSVIRAPRDFALFGSTDNVTWTKLDDRSNISFGAAEEKVFTVSTTASYSYLSIVINRIGAADTAEIDNLKFFGIIDQTTTANAVSARYLKLSKPTIVPQLDSPRIEVLDTIGNNVVSTAPVVNNNVLKNYVSPTIASPLSSRNYTPVQNGLIAWFDPNDPLCYSGTGATLGSLIGTGISGTIGGTSSFANGTIRLSNTSVFDTANVSYLQLNTLTNITTISLWYYQHSAPTTRALLDGRAGNNNAVFNSTGVGSIFSTVYKNNTSITTTWNSTETVGKWQNVTIISNTPFTDDLTLFARFTNFVFGLDVTFGPILIYNRAITQAENEYNFNAVLANYFSAPNPALPITNGLIAWFDPSDTRCYSGTGATLGSLIPTSTSGTGGTLITGTLEGAYSYNSSDGTINIINTTGSATTNTSNFQLQTLSGVSTISMWIRYNSITTGIERKLIDARTGSTDTYLGVSRGGAFANGSGALMSINGGSLQDTVYSDIEKLGWQNITLYPSSTISDDITFFARHSPKLDGLDVTFGPILIYNRVLTEAENRTNYEMMNRRLLTRMSQKTQQAEFPQAGKRSLLYPPVALASDSVSVSSTSTSYGAGVYSVSVSSTSNGAAWNALDGSSGTFWTSAASGYNTSTGAYAGTVSTSDVLGNTYSGDYLQIKTPDPLFLTGVSIAPNTTTFATSAPTSFSLLGSRNGIDYQTLLSTTASFATAGSQLFSINGTSGAAASFDNFRLVTNSITPATREYPPAAMTAATTNITSGTYGTGSYTASRSSFGYDSDNTVFDKNISSAARTQYYYDQQGNYLGNTSLPPGNMTSGTIVISSGTTGVGTYVVTASSENGTDFAYNACDDNVNTVWSSAANYNSTTGSYIGSTLTNGTVAGEWIQIQLPTSKTINTVQLTFHQTNFSSTAPKTIRIAGSSTGANGSWGIGNPITISNPGTSVQTININSFVTRQYWRIIITDVGTSTNGTGQDRVQLSEFRVRCMDTSVTTTDTANTVHAGEWYQLSMPSPIVMKSLNITAAGTLSETPSLFALLGSNNGSLWDLLYNTPSAVTWTQNTTPVSFPLTTTTAYSRYRLVTKKSNTNVTALREISYTESNAGIASISEVQLFGGTINSVRGLQAFPPAAMTAATTAMLGTSYGSGTYIASASSTLSTIGSFYAFDNSLSTYWHSSTVADNLYNTTTGAYLGNTTMTAGNVGYAGEWIQLQTPNLITADSIAITLRQDSNLWSIRSLDTFHIFGSRNGMSWDLLKSFSNVNNWTQASKYFTVDSTRSYNYFRLLTTVIGQSGTNVNRNTVQIAEWKLYGREFVSPIREFPPGPMSADTTTLSGYPHGEGSYVASANSTSGGSASWNAFDDSFATSWLSSNTYNATTGSYLGSTSMTAGSIGYTGEWLQLQAPNSIRPTSYTLTPNATLFASRSPSTFYLFGSTDNVTYTLLDTETAITWANSPQTFQLSTASSFSYFRLLTTVVGNSGTRDTVEIVDLSIFGEEQLSSNYLVTDLGTDTAVSSIRVVNDTTSTQASSTLLGSSLSLINTAGTETYTHALDSQKDVYQLLDTSSKPAYTTTQTPFTQLLSAHNDARFLFDAEYDGTAKPSSSAVPFSLEKARDTLLLQTGSISTAGSLVSFSSSMTISNSGLVAFGSGTALQKLFEGTALAGTGNANVNSFTITLPQTLASSSYLTFITPEVPSGTEVFYTTVSSKTVSSFVVNVIRSDAQSWSSALSINWQVFM